MFFFLSVGIFRKILTSRTISTPHKFSEVIPVLVAGVENLCAILVEYYVLLEYEYVLCIIVMIISVI